MVGRLDPRGSRRYSPPVRNDVTSRHSSQMSRAATCLIAAILFAIGAAIRVNNAMVFSPLRAYDGYAHFSYIWFLAENWRIPLPTSGWEFFQPPLYYAW